MKEQQIINQPISDELKGKLDVLIEAVAGIVGLASSCGLKEEAKALADYSLSMRAMRFGEQAYDRKLCKDALDMVLPVNQQMKEIRAKKSAAMIKSCGDYDYYGYSYSANEVKVLDTKNDFCPTLGNDSGLDENASSINE